MEFLCMDELNASDAIMKNIETVVKTIYRNGAALDADVLRDLVPYPGLFEETMVVMESLGLVSKSEYGNYDEDVTLTDPTLRRL